MSQAFEVTNDDLSNVYHNAFKMRLDPDSAQADRIMDRLDLGAVEQAALDADIGDETDDEEILNLQTQAAYAETERQIRAFSN